MQYSPMRLLSFLLATIMFHTASAQYQIESLNFPAVDKGKYIFIDDIVVDNSGNTYTRKSERISCSPLSSSTIVKQDKFGRIVWEQKISNQIVQQDYQEKALLLLGDSLLFCFSYDTNSIKLIGIDTAGIQKIYFSQAQTFNHNCEIGFVEMQDSTFGLYIDVRSGSIINTLFLFNTQGNLIKTYGNLNPNYRYNDQYFRDNRGNVYLRYIERNNNSNWRLQKQNSDGVLIYDTIIYGQIAGVDNDGNLWIFNTNDLEKRDSAYNLIWTNGNVESNHVNFAFTKSNDLFFTSYTQNSTTHFCWKVRSDGSIAFRTPVRLSALYFYYPFTHHDVADYTINELYSKESNTNSSMSYKFCVSSITLDTSGKITKDFYEELYYKNGIWINDACHTTDKLGNIYFAIPFRSPSSLFECSPLVTTKEYHKWMSLKLCNECNYNISGRIAVDDNSNCVVDSSEKALKGVIVYLSPDDRYSVSNKNGDYYFREVDNGKHRISVFPPADLISYCDTFFEFNVDTANLYSNHDFLLYPSSDCVLETFVSGSRARAGFIQDLVINFTELGIPKSETWMCLVMDSNFVFDSSKPQPDSISGKKIYWKFNNSDIYDQGTVNVELRVPSSLQITTPYRHDIFAFNECFEAADSLAWIITGSYDPNEKVLFPYQLSAKASFDSILPLVYQINFQNTGNDTAFRVEVVDTISRNLDLGSLKMIAASHNYTLEVRDNREVRWIFEKILLPDSTTNLSASQGFVKFRIKPVHSLKLGDTIRNSASIYFDFNEPILTNELVTVYKLDDKEPIVDTVQNPPKPIDTTVIQPVLTEKITVFPNPASNAFSIHSNRTYKESTPAIVSITDVTGRKIYDLEMPGWKGEINVNTTDVASGFYVIKLAVPDRAINHVQRIEVIHK